MEKANKIALAQRQIWIMSAQKNVQKMSKIMQNEHKMHKKGQKTFLKYRVKNQKVSTAVQN